MLVKDWAEVTEFRTEELAIKGLLAWTDYVNWWARADMPRINLVVRRQGCEIHARGSRRAKLLVVLYFQAYCRGFLNGYIDGTE